jgi:ribonuclease T2
VALVCVVAFLADARRRQARPGTPGQFAYYVLSLSWSPEHCASHPGQDLQCGGVRQYGFVLHGLWPQHERGFPADCASAEQPSDRLVRSLLDISPSEKLVRHEWAKHGTCSDLAPEDYFALARRAFGSVRVPARFQAPAQAARLSVAALEAEFAAVNAGLTGDQVAVQCSGRFLQELRVCLDKTLRPRACGPEVRDRCQGDVTIRPWR